MCSCCPATASSAARNDTFGRRLREFATTHVGPAYPPNALTLLASRKLEGRRPALHAASTRGEEWTLPAFKELLAIF